MKPAFRALPRNTKHCTHNARIEMLTNLVDIDNVYGYCQTDTHFFNLLNNIIHMDLSSKGFPDTDYLNLEYMFRLFRLSGKLTLYGNTLRWKSSRTTAINMRCLLEFLACKMLGARTDGKILSYNHKKWLAPYLASTKKPHQLLMKFTLRF